MSGVPLGAAARLWAWAAVLRPLKHVVPLDSLVRLVRPAAGRRRGPEFVQQLEAYMTATARFPARAPANCLERSLGVYRLLCAAGARPDVVVGVRRGTPGGVEGHVWITLDGRALAERPEFLSTFTTVVTYDADGRQRAPGSPAERLAGVHFA